MSIIDPTTGRTFDHDRLLTCIEDWTRQPDIQKAMLVSGVADVTGLIRLVAAVRLANENKHGGLTETQACAVIYQMLGTKKVRKAIARYVSREEGLTRWEVTRDLVAMLDYSAERIGERRYDA